MRPPVGHVTPVRGPWGPDVAHRNDADSGHGGPPADGETAIRLTLVSVRRPATGYPSAAASGQELLTKGFPAPGRPHRSAGSRQDIADGGGYGGRGLVDGAVPGFHQ